MDEAYRICDNLIVMEKGRAIANDAKVRIFERPDSVGLARLTGCKNFSRAAMVGERVFEAIDWGVKLHTVEEFPEDFAYTGIRAHQIQFTSDRTRLNTFPCWLANVLEAPHRVTLYLKLNEPSGDEKDFHIQAELYKDRWQEIKDKPFPWLVTLDPLRLLLLESK
jgi:molybdate transport system permease protein